MFEVKKYFTFRNPFLVVSFLGPENQRLLENFVFLSLNMTAVNLADILNKRVWKLYSAIIVFSNV